MTEVRATNAGGVSMAGLSMRVMVAQLLLAASPLQTGLVVHKKRRNILLKLYVIKGNISVLLSCEFCFLRVLRSDL